MGNRIQPCFGSSCREVRRKLLNAPCAYLWKVSLFLTHQALEDSQSLHVLTWQKMFFTHCCAVTPSSRARCVYLHASELSFLEQTKNTKSKAIAVQHCF